MNSCQTCAMVVRESQDPKLTRWLRERGLAFCKAYTQRHRKKTLIALENAAGMLCGGRWYESNGELI